MRMKLVVALMLVGSVAGCATITRGKDEVVKFTSDPAGAKVATSTGFSCTTPCETKIARKQPFQAVFTLGKKQKKVDVVTKTQGGGMATGVGNVVAGGIIGIAVDAGTGATLDHVPNPVHADFK